MSFEDYVEPKVYKFRIDAYIDENKTLKDIIESVEEAIAYELNCSADVESIKYSPDVYSYTTVSVGPISTKDSFTHLEDEVQRIISEQFSQELADISVTCIDTLP